LAADGPAPLRTGWEPDAPDDDTVARQALVAHLFRLAHTAQASGGRWTTDADVAMADLGLPGLFGNQAFLLRPDRSSVALDRIDAFFAGGQAFLLVSPFPTGDLRDRGLELMGHPPLMYRPIDGQAPPPPPAELRVEEVADEGLLASFERTLIDAYPVHEWASLPPGRAFPAALLGTSGVRFWTGSIDERTVCTASAAVHAGVNLVEYVSTDPACRGRGYGAALTWAAATAEPGLPAILLSSDDGRPVYRRMGFVAISRWTLWSRPSAVQSE
jgi:GNAT superfamily N-acetyltransferase